MNLRNQYCLFGLIFWVFSSSCIADIEVVDDLGRKVVLKQPAQRIVALAPHVVENLYAVGAGAKIVGAVDYSDYPESAKKITRVGSYNAFSVESIVALHPDLVIVWYSGRGGKIINKLLALGLTVYADNPESLTDLAKSFNNFGALAGTPLIANKKSEWVVQQHERLKQQYSSEKTLGVFYQVWNQPLQTLNGEHIISDVIELCGGRNVFHDSVAVAPKVSIESILKVNPDVIVSSGMGGARPKWLDEWQHWPSISAVKANNVFFIPPDIIQRHTMRMLDGAKLMCEYLKKSRENLKF